VLFGAPELQAAAECGDYHFNALARTCQFRGIARIGQKNIVHGDLPKLCCRPCQRSNVMRLLLEFVQDCFADAATRASDEYVCHVASWWFCARR
jgi:hypothetical protein